MGLWRPFDRRAFDKLDSRSKGWVAQEAHRRRGLLPERFCSSVLLSYPRSGNHLLRFLVEYATRRPTLGAIDAETSPIPLGLHDLPIFLRVKGMRAANPLPILVKRHSLFPDESFAKTILLVREPIEAILSHLKHDSDEDFEKNVHREVAIFAENLRVFDLEPSVSKLRVEYSQLTTDPGAALHAVLSFLDASTLTSRARAKAAVLKRSLAYTSLERPDARGAQKYRDLFPDRADYLRSML